MTLFAGAEEKQGRQSTCKTGAFQALRIFTKKRQNATAEKI